MIEVPVSSIKLLDLLQQARETFANLSPDEQQEVERLQRKSWCIGELMLEHPEMSRERAEELWAITATNLGIKP